MSKGDACVQRVARIERARLFAGVKPTFARALDCGCRIARAMFARRAATFVRAQAACVCAGFGIAKDVKSCRSRSRSRDYRTCRTLRSPFQSDAAKHSSRFCLPIGDVVILDRAIVRVARQHIARAVAVDIAEAQQLPIAADRRDLIIMASAISKSRFAAWQTREK